MHKVATFVVQFEQGETLQETFDRLDEGVEELGDIMVHSIQDVIHNNEPPASPHNAEYGYRVFPGEAAVERILVYTEV